MPTTCSAGSTDKLYDVDYVKNKDEYWFAFSMMVTGLDPANFANTTIDEHVEALRETFNMSLDPAATQQHEIFLPTAFAAHHWTRSQYRSFIYQMRLRWQTLQICKYLETR